MKKHLRVGIFTDTCYPEINGVANSVYQLKKELEKRGHRVFVFTVTNPGVKRIEPGVFRTHSIPFVLLSDRRMSVPVPKMWMNKIRRLRLDIIHTQTEFGLGHLGRKAAQSLNIPYIHTYHTIYEDYTHYFKVPGNEHLKPLVRKVSRICCNRAEVVIVPTQKVKTLLRSYGVKKKIYVQPTGVDLDKFQSAGRRAIDKLRKKYHIQPTDRILMFVGRLSQEKNISELIDFMPAILRLCPETRLFIVGEGPEAEKLEKKAQEMNLLDHVTFTGPVKWEHIQNYYALCDIFTCASKSETQGLTYGEALAAGKPILVRRDDCLNEILREGENGCGYDNMEEYLEGFRKLCEIDHSPAAERAIAESVRKISTQRFARNTEKIYQRVLQTWEKQKIV